MRRPKTRFEVKLSEESDKSKKVSLKVTVVWLMTCLLGNCFQFYHISSHYFSYGITTNVQMVTENNFTVPVTILCFDTLQVIQWHKLTHSERRKILQDDLGADIFDYEVSNEDDESVKSIASIVKVSREILPRFQATSNLQALNNSRIFEVTYKFQDMFDRIAVYLEKDSKTGVSRDYPVFLTNSPGVYNVFEVTEFLKDMFRCYSLKFKQPVMNHYHVTRQVGRPGAYAIITLNQIRVNDTSTMYFIANQNANLTGGFFPGLQMPSKIDHIQHLTYEVFETKLLKAPYETKCIEYSELGLGSRGECFEGCIRNESITATGMIHPSLTIHGGETRKAIKVLDIMQNVNNTKTLMDSLEDLCDKRCHAKDCQSVMYIPKLLSTVPMFDLSVVVNNAPHSPLIRATCQEAVSLVQYLTDVASTFGFWLGVSAFGFVDFLKVIMNRVHLAFAPKTKPSVIQRVRKQRRKTERPTGGSWVLVSSPHAIPDPGWKCLKSVTPDK